MYFFFNDTAPTEIYTYRHTLSLHDALPILSKPPLSFLTRSYLPHGTAALRLTLSSPAISRRGVMPDRRTGGPCAIMFMPPFGAQVSDPTVGGPRWWAWRSEEHTSELQSLMRSPYAVF